jgi:ATPase subunit of ABC transporter with duplicated ATPase domains
VRPDRSTPSIHLRGVTYAYTSATPILREASLDLSATGSRWVGLVGANGAGKTTVLRLLAGALAPTGGTIAVQGDLRMLVPQDADDLTADVVGFAASWDGAAARLRGRLELDPDQLEARWPSLSPGQRKRWQVAAALVAAPDLLLLDEPTNHLDGAARDLLVAALAGFRGLGVIVSHDRSVLDRLTDRTLRLHRGRLTLHAGGYSDAAARWRAAEAAEHEAHDRAMREERRIRRQLADARRARSDTERGTAAARRRGDDPEARSAGARFVAARAERAHAKRAAAAHSRLERARADADGFDLAREPGGAVAAEHVRSERQVLAQLVGDVEHAGGGVLLHDVDLVLRRGDRIRVAGANGAGKTSLLRALTDVLVARGEQVGLLPQELDVPAEEVRRVRATDPATRGRLLGVVALLGVDPDRVLVTDDPSPGEARKLALAGLLTGPASVLVLDEPTNHLDLPSIERLEEALVSWPGALLLVTHDEALATAATTARWEVRDGEVQHVR